MVNRTHMLEDLGLNLIRVKKQRRRRRSRLSKAFKSPMRWRREELQSQVGNLCIACLDMRRSKSSSYPFDSSSSCLERMLTCESLEWPMKYFIVLEVRITCLPNHRLN